MEPIWTTLTRDVEREIETGRAQAKVARLLADLGDTPETVAAFLEGQGVRAQENLCPVAVYLVANGFPQVAVYNRSTYVNSVDVRGVVNPSAVEGFTLGFDAGVYPTLQRLPRPNA